MWANLSSKGKICHIQGKRKDIHIHTYIPAAITTYRVITPHNIQRILGTDFNLVKIW